MLIFFSRYDGAVLWLSLGVIAFVAWIAMRGSKPPPEPPAPKADPKTLETFFEQTRSGYGGYRVERVEVNLRTMRMVRSFAQADSGLGFSDTPLHVRRKPDGTWQEKADVESEKRRLRKNAEDDAKSPDPDFRKEMAALLEADLKRLDADPPKWTEISDDWVGRLEEAYQRYVRAAR